MNLARLLGSWNGVQQENRWLRGALLALVATNLVTAVVAARRDRTVVLVPPALEGTVSVSRTGASPDLKTAWGLFVAELIGNVTPGNAATLTRVIEPLLSPRIHHGVLEAIASQSNALKLDRVALAFEPREVLYEQDTDRVFVSGVQTSTGPTGSAQRRVRSYEMRFVIRNYRPYLDAIDVYPGSPRTRASAPAGAAKPAAAADAAAGASPDLAATEAP
ncbi:MAG: TraE/TraK family type IV conjugative transfer system protein [Gammaproteobacteria bacterium]